MLLPFNKERAVIVIDQRIHRRRPFGARSEGAYHDAMPKHALVIDRGYFCIEVEQDELGSQGVCIFQISE